MNRRETTRTTKTIALLVLGAGVAGCGSAAVAAPPTRAPAAESPDVDATTSAAPLYVSVRRRLSSSSPGLIRSHGPDRFSYDDIRIERSADGLLSAAPTALDAHILVVHETSSGFFFVLDDGRVVRSPDYLGDPVDVANPGRGLSVVTGAPRLIVLGGDGRLYTTAGDDVRSIEALDGWVVVESNISDDGSGYALEAGGLRALTTDGGATWSSFGSNTTSVSPLSVARRLQMARARRLLLHEATADAELDLDEGAVLAALAPHHPELLDARLRSVGDGRWLVSSPPRVVDASGGIHDAGLPADCSTVRDSSRVVCRAEIYGFVAATERFDALGGGYDRFLTASDDNRWALFADGCAGELGLMCLKDVVAETERTLHFSTRYTQQPLIIGDDAMLAMGDRGEELIRIPYRTGIPESVNLPELGGRRLPPRKTGGLVVVPLMKADVAAQFGRRETLFAEHHVTLEGAELVQLPEGTTHTVWRDDATGLALANGGISHATSDGGRTWDALPTTNASPEQARCGALACYFGPLVVRFVEDAAAEGENEALSATTLACDMEREGYGYRAANFSGAPTLDFKGTRSVEVQWDANGTVATARGAGAWIASVDRHSPPRPIYQSAQAAIFVLCGRRDCYTVHARAGGRVTRLSEAADDIRQWHEAPGGLLAGVKEHFGRARLVIVDGSGEVREARSAFGHTVGLAMAGGEPALFVATGSAGVLARADGSQQRLDVDIEAATTRVCQGDEVATIRLFIEREVGDLERLVGQGTAEIVVHDAGACLNGYAWNETARIEATAGTLSGTPLPGATITCQ